MVVSGTYHIQLTMSLRKLFLGLGVSVNKSTHIFRVRREEVYKQRISFVVNVYHDVLIKYEKSSKGTSILSFRYSYIE